jgi:hypothetical protein
VIVEVIVFLEAKKDAVTPAAVLPFHLVLEKLLIYIA